MLTRLTWTGGSALIIVLASASLVWAEPAGTEVGRDPKAASDLSQRMQNSRAARDDQNSALAPFLSGPACEVPDSTGSGGHLGWVRTRNQGLIGGSYGEVFFASGAGTSAVPASAVTTGSRSGGSSGSGGGGSPTTPTTTPGKGSGGSTSPAAGTSGASSGANGDDGAVGTGTGGGSTHPPAGGGSGGPVGPPIWGGPPPAANPEPTTLILLGTGLAGVLFTERRRRSKK